MRNATLLTIMTLTVGVVACGNSDDKGGPTAAEVGNPTPDFGAPESAEERAVADAVEAIYADVAERDSSAVCKGMTDAIAAQLAASGSDCGPVVERLLGQSERSGGLEHVDEARVGRVRLEGGAATATVSFGSQAARLTLNRTNGEWRLASPLALPSGAPAKPGRVPEP